MLQSVEERELITLRRLGPLVHGTFHKGRDKNPVVGDEKRVGILFKFTVSAESCNWRFLCLLGGLFC